MELIKCLFCGKPTTLHKINVPKKMKGKVVTLTNAPVYFCKPCNETFIAKETQEVFRYIQDRNLDDKLVLFNYDDMIKKV